MKLNSKNWENLLDVLDYYGVRIDDFGDFCIFTDCWGHLDLETAQSLADGILKAIRICNVLNEYEIEEDVEDESEKEICYDEIFCAIDNEDWEKFLEIMEGR